MRALRQKGCPLQLQRALHSGPGLHKSSPRAIRQGDEAAIWSTPGSHFSPFLEAQAKCAGIVKGSKKGWPNGLSYVFLILFRRTTVLVMASKRFLSGSVIWLTARRIRSKARTPLPRDAQSLAPFCDTFLGGGSSCPS